MIGHITETYTTAARRHCRHSEYVLRTDVRSQEGNEISNEESIESSILFLPRVNLIFVHVFRCGYGVLEGWVQSDIVHSCSWFVPSSYLRSRSQTIPTRRSACSAVLTRPRCYSRLLSISNYFSRPLALLDSTCLPHLFFSARITSQPSFLLK